MYLALTPCFGLFQCPRLYPSFPFPSLMTCRESAAGSFASDLTGNCCLLISCFYILSSNACFFYFVVLRSFLVLLPWATLQKWNFVFSIILNPCLDREMLYLFFPFECYFSSSFSPSSFPMAISQMIAFRFHSLEETNSKKAGSANTVWIQGSVSTRALPSVECCGSLKGRNMLASPLWYPRLPKTKGTVST